LDTTIFNAIPHKNDAANKKKNIILTTVSVCHVVICVDDLRAQCQGLVTGEQGQGQGQGL